MKFYLTLFFVIYSLYSFSQSQSKINVILIGTYHFNNPGFDEGKVKERNILSQENQKDLEQISDKLIKKYKPSKVFVEYDFAQENKLNEMFQAYKNGEKFYDLDTLNSFYKRYYTENEIFQFGFRLASKAKNKSIYSIDYDEVPIRFDLIKSKLETKSNITFENYKLKMVLYCL